MSSTGLPESEPNQKPICESKPQSNRDKLVQLGWRQGSVLPPGLVAQLAASGSLPAALPATSLIIVVSHDCDLIHGSFEKEPTAEVFHFRVAMRPEGHYYYGKNPRKIQIDVAGATYEAGIWDRYPIPRPALLEAAPASIEVGRREVREIARWISKRYVRAAFANAFEERTARAQRKIKDLLRPASKFISAIYLLMDDQELPSDQAYEVSVVTTMPPVLYGNPNLRAEVDAAMMKVADLLGRTPGIQIAESEVISERDLSVAALEELKRWDYDSLSNREDPPDPLTPSTPM